MDKVTVIQADREAAADIASIVRDQTFSSKHICDGLHDEHRVVQSFAKHRETSATPAPDSEKLREALERIEAMPFTKPGSAYEMVKIARSVLPPHLINAMFAGLGDAK